MYEELSTETDVASTQWFRNLNETSNKANVRTLENGWLTRRWCSLHMVSFFWFLLWGLSHCPMILKGWHVWGHRIAFCSSLVLHKDSSLRLMLNQYVTKLVHSKVLVNKKKKILFYRFFPYSSFICTWPKYVC